MELTLPTPSYILGAIIFGLVGYVAFRHGRKSSRLEMTLCGIALMLYPYAVSQTWVLWAVGLALTAWAFFTWK